MGFFSLGSDESGERENITSIIGVDMQLVGDVTFKGKLRLDGKAEGNIRGEYLILGETGIIVGDVDVSTFVCSGRVEGNLNVKNLYVIKGGIIEGKVETMDLSVESGAVMNGEIKSRTQELRLVPGTAIPEDEWESRMKEVSSNKSKQVQTANKKVVQK
ncbi:MAG: polymer-forming cytoskeletal protein [Desulfobulbaceae bacterium]|nr:polymer-forming cytoskeletal protein [Desulfobulbaceae bacterium]HIJ79150.1 polymer-forming cytoskeletal protein [Deltaproteobacteria bacterium]